MRIITMAAMFYIVFSTGCGMSNYGNDIAVYKIFEYDFPNSEHHEIKPLDKHQIERMAKQLIPPTVISQEGNGRVILASKDKKIMKDFQEYLNKELPKGWNINWLTSDADAIVTGDLFGGFSIKKESKIVFRVKQKPPPKSVNPALFLFWTVKTDLKIKKVLSATDNYENPKVTAAIEDLAKDLQRQDKREEDWKIALINKFEDSEDSKLVTAAVLSEFVTTTVFQEVVNTQTSLIFLDKDDTSKHNTKLRQALWPDKDQNTFQQIDFAKTFSKSTGANVVLIIEQLSDGHFDLKLIEVPGFDLLAIGKSDNKLKE